MKTTTTTALNGETIEIIDYSEWRASVEVREMNRKIHRQGWEHNVECKMFGRKMSSAAIAKARSVHMTTNLDLVRVDIDEAIIDSQGFFEVGSECAKRLPKGFVTKAGA